jgi:transcriptional regulator GlxA family with amidase domain
MANKEAKVVEEQGAVDAEVPYFKNIMDYVEDNIDKKITISDLANRSRWKEQHFIRVLLIILEKHLISIF